ncbi:hypothetical protein [uncultured Brevundimonas sp.]|uniref:hypothetical protein n=1 Tax=uncultured Brevundimonas sp. TaxID=213418 RepID=UPI0030EB48AD|tara:strand:+ start:47942 stop:48292 length:351 start_codon:yes stop_codon:yes gene_type:complete
MDHDQFGRDLADRLYAAEHAVDLAIAALGDLGCAMVRGRMEHGISAVVGQVALSDVTATLPIIVKARKRLVRAHRQMLLDARALRIDWTASLSGPETKPTEGSGFTETIGRLRRVA